MSTQHPRGPVVATVARAAAVGLVAGLTAVAVPQAATANPSGTGASGCAVSTGDVRITSSTSMAEGQRVSYAGTGFARGGNTAVPAMQQLSLKLDAFDSSRVYSGTAAGASQVVGTTQVQADGSISGSFVVPADIDDTRVNPTAAGPHFLRFLGSNPGTSCWSEDFTVDAAAPAQPVATATSAVAAGRGAATHTLTVTGSGFAPGEDISIRKALATSALSWTTGTGAAATTAPTIKADADGKISGRVVVGLGVLPSGEHQLVLGRSSAPSRPVTTQVTVATLPAFSNLALATDATLTVSNAAPGTVISSVTIDPDPARAGDDLEVLRAPATAGSDAVATATVRVPEGPYLGTKTFTITESFPFARTYVVSAKVSPDATVFGTEKFDVLSTADGAIEQGLYQSAYAAATDSLFATTANVLATSTLYKLDPRTLAVRASVVPARETEGSANLWAAYGVGVDDEHRTVWVTNTRQNTVAIYSQDDLSLVKQFPRKRGTAADAADTVTHSRDVVVDPATDQVFVTSASEGSTGKGSIAVFESDDKNGNGVKHEFIKDIAVYDRTVFSPMSLELDVASGKLFTTSLTTQKAMVVDTTTLRDTIFDLPELLAGGRGASGVAYDPVTRRLFVASQNSDEMLIAQVAPDFSRATTIKEVPTGAGALNVHFDPTTRLAYVANFGGTTITVADVDGTKVANLPLVRPNHVSYGPGGVVYAVNKDASNRVVRISPRVPATTPVTPPAAPVTPAPPAAAPVALKVGRAVVKGRAVVGAKVRATTTGWSAGTRFTYTWRVGSKVVKGKTGSSLRLTRAMVGKPVKVTVTGTLTGAAPVSKQAKAGRVTR